MQIQSRYENIVRVVQDVAERIKTHEANETIERPHQNKHVHIIYQGYQIQLIKIKLNKNSVN